MSKIDPSKKHALPTSKIKPTQLTNQAPFEAHC